MSEFITELRTPKIYAYSDSRFPDCLKIGYTTRDVKQRVAEQYPVKLPNQSYQVVFAFVMMVRVFAIMIFTRFYKNEALSVLMASGLNAI